MLLVSVALRLVTDCSFLTLKITTRYFSASSCFDFDVPMGSGSYDGEGRASILFHGGGGGGLATAGQAGG